jgi:hypothetical protein
MANAVPNAGQLRSELSILPKPPHFRNELFGDAVSGCCRRMASDEKSQDFTRTHRARHAREVLVALPIGT